MGLRSVVLDAFYLGRDAVLVAAEIVMDKGRLWPPPLWRVVPGRGVVAVLRSRRVTGGVRLALVQVWRRYLDDKAPAR